jgi:hypothetical protein
MGGAVAVLLIKERHIVDAFEAAGATTAERAQSPADLGVDSGGVAWHRLRNRAIVRDAGEGRFYVDRETWQATRRMRQRRLLVVVALVIVVAIVMVLRQR